MEDITLNQLLSDWADEGHRYVYGAVKPTIERIKIPDILNRGNQLIEAFLLPIKSSNDEEFVITTRLLDVPGIGKEYSEKVNNYQKTPEKFLWVRGYHGYNIDNNFTEYVKKVNNLNQNTTGSNTIVANPNRRTTTDSREGSFESVAVDLLLFKYFPKNGFLKPHILLIKRNNPSNLEVRKRSGGKWALPGGMVEAENPDKGMYLQALREAEEEAGIKPSEVTLKGNLGFHSAKEREKIDPKFAGTLPYVGVYSGTYKFEITEEEYGTPIDSNEEILDAHWFDLDDLNQISFTFSDHKNFIQEAASRFSLKPLSKKGSYPVGAEQATSQPQIGTTSELTQEDLTPRGPTTSRYGEQLKREGFRYPAHEQPGRKYTDVHGNPAIADPNRPYMLVTYRPRKSEQYFASLGDAQAQRPESGDWQILNSLTGEILDEPEKDIRAREQTEVERQERGVASSLKRIAETLKPNSKG